MKRWSRRVLSAVLLVVMAFSVAATPAVPATAAPADDIVARLTAIPGMRLLWERPSGDPAYRFLMLGYRQPADHRRPGGTSFEQRFSLMHRATDRPMVLHTTGYDVPQVAFRSEPAQLIDGNQISVEQRYFSPSRPEPANWNAELRIRQAAADHHRLVTALKPVYTGKWISTGASKGGMTSVYHRRFYPGDVQGTVAYVAPNDVRNFEDRAYDRFFARVGTDSACHKSLQAVQREVLKRRAEFVRRYEAFAQENGYSFGYLRTVDRALEATVLDIEWAFWQYSLESDCASVPAAVAPTDELWSFVHQTADFSFYTDQGLAPYSPYYFQAATELGWPEPKFAHLKDLRRYPDLYQPRWFLPADLRARLRFHPAAMADIDRWVRSRGERLMFLYGQNDPWGAEPFRLGRAKDSLWYEVEGLNHSGRLIGRLPEAERTEATAALRRWAGTGSASTLRVRDVRSIDHYDELLVRRPRL